MNTSHKSKPQDLNNKHLPNKLNSQSYQVQNPLTTCFNKRKLSNPRINSSKSSYKIPSH